MDLSRPTDLIRKWIPLAIVGVAVVAIPTYVLAGRQTPVYEASVSLLPQQLLPASDPDYNSTSVARLVGLSTTWSVIAETPAILDAAATTLGIEPDTVALDKAIDVAVDANNAVLTITARAAKPGDAVDLANAVGAAIAEQSAPEPANPTSLVSDLDRLRTQIRDNEAEYQQLLLTAGTDDPVVEAQLAAKVALLEELRATYDSLAASMRTVPDGLIVVDGAQLAEVRQTAPRAIYYTSLAVAAGLLLTLALAALLVFLDDRVRDPATIRRITGLATLGSVGRRRRLMRRETVLPTITAPTSSEAEAYLTLRAALRMLPETTTMKTLLVAGTGEPRGAVRTAANLAVAFAQAGDRVLLVDADLRKPQLHRLFSVPGEFGLTTLMRDPSVPALRVSAAVAGLERLRVLPAGDIPLDPAQMLGSMMFRARLERFAADSDIVILVAPPLDAAVDGSIVAGIANHTILVVDSEKNNEATLLTAAELLLRANARVVGAVLYRARRGLFGRYGDRKSVNRDAQGAYDPRVSTASGPLDSR